MAMHSASPDHGGTVYRPKDSHLAQSEPRNSHTDHSNYASGPGNRYSNHQGGREEVLEGTNFVLPALAHIVLCVAYIVIPALHTATKAGYSSKSGPRMRTSNPEIDLTMRSSGLRNAAHFVTAELRR